MKGQVDILFLTVMFVGVCISMFVIYYVWQAGLKPQLQSAFVTGQPAATANTENTILNAGSSSLDALNNSLLFIYFAMATAIIIGAFLVSATPIFFVAGIFFVAIDLLIAVIMHNVFFTVLQTSYFAPYLAQYPFLVLLVMGYPVITFVIALVVLVVTFSPKGGEY